MNAAKNAAILLALIASQLVAIRSAALDQLVIALAVHLSGSALALLMAWRPRAERTSSAAALRVATALAPALGPIASVSGLIMVALAALRNDTVPNARDWYEHLFPNSGGDEWSVRADEASRRGPVRDDDDVASFRDVLAWGTLAEREHMLTLVGRSYRPEFASVLRDALNGGDPGLRAQAAAGLSLLESRLSARIVQAREAWSGGLGAENADALLALVHALGDSAHSGLYDPARTREMREEIVDRLTPYVAATADGTAAMLLGRALIQLGSMDVAIATLEAACADDPSSPAFPWLIEALYRTRDFESLEGALQARRTQADHLIADDGPLAPALQLWLEAA